MNVSFLEHIGDIEDPRVMGMVLSPLNEVLVTVLVGLLCRAEDLVPGGGSLPSGL